MQITIDFLQQTFKGLFEYQLLQELTAVAQLKKLSAGSYLIRPGEYIRSVPLILSGSVKIMRPDSEGREALLYYLSGLDSCAMSLTCCIGSRQSEIIVLAEEDTLLLAIPAEKVDEWLCRYPSWKRFVFETYQKRFNNLLTTLDEVIFHKLDERLLAYLDKKAANCQCQEFTITHEEVAQDLATSREVISRLLKQLEKEGLIKLRRNRIVLLQNRAVL